MPIDKKTLLALTFLTVLPACGEAKETCTCTCTCGSGAKSTIEGAKSEEECASACDMECGVDSYNTNYDCKTEGATSETPLDR